MAPIDQRPGSPLEPRPEKDGLRYDIPVRIAGGAVGAVSIRIWDGDGDVKVAISGRAVAWLREHDRRA